MDMERVAARGLLPGGWLPELKRRFFADWPAAGPLTVLRQEGETVREEPVVDAESLYGELRGHTRTAGIGYLTDFGYTADNLAKIEPFLAGTTLLVGECAFLARDVHKARASHHLCTTDWNELLARLRPRYFLPMHLSKTYLGKCPELFAELAPPPGTTILQLPEHRTPRPIFASEALQLWR
jgi:ribonuclease Z